MRHILATATFVCTASLTLLAQTTVTVPCTRDNTLYESATGALSGGAATGVFVGVTGQASGTLRRALLYFDVAAMVPAGARILDATLDVTVSQSSAFANININGHRLVEDWGEGTTVPVGGFGGGGAGGPASGNDATWLHTFSPGSTWITAGGSFANPISFFIDSPPLGAASSTFSATMLSDVQDMLDNPAQNFGWLLKTDEALASVARRLDSRETTIGTPPTLTVTYLTDGQVTTWGQGCPVGTGTFQHAWSAAPIGGTTPNLTQTNGPANALAANILALEYSPAGFPLLPSCNFYLPFPGLVVTHSILNLDASGSASTPLSLPTGFPGVMFTSQTAALDSSPSGFVLSNAAIALLQ